ncbi:hypothetical protein SISSUDRAFT_881144 [Sistotremastrum suecicum HHB10207 ss-3]|uniref:Uncharacterized protein n=1 Tax=Sistotremastrum suecicum HHB10207 ss-3 TaxID=1314776 RepID=A0A166C7P8_9AGAM|nr:hypothetical protein SISSUDRAFT_881144 [Sistotremastrum suecicum HHB10207 ss-3]
MHGRSFWASEAPEYALFLTPRNRPHLRDTFFRTLGGKYRSPSRQIQQFSVERTSNIFQGAPWRLVFHGAIFLLFPFDHMFSLELLG